MRKRFYALLCMMTLMLTSVGVMMPVDSIHAEGEMQEEKVSEESGFSWMDGEPTVVVGYRDNEITKLVIPEKTTGIGFQAFNSFKKLTSVVFPENLTMIGRYAFFQCTNLDNIEIPKSVTDIQNVKI